MNIKCDLCENIISKYDLDFRINGGRQYSFNKKEKNICEDCCKIIAISLIEEI